MTFSAGLHHITALSGNIRRTHDFYTRLLGLRLVKRTVTAEDQASWHLTFGDELGTPGACLSFMSWEDTRAGVPGAGEAVTIALAIPPGSAPFWSERLADEGISIALDHGSSTPVIAFHDPDGIGLELVEEPVRGESHPHTTMDVPLDRAITGLSGATLLVEDIEASARVLMDVLGWRESGRAHLPGFERVRFTMPDSTSQGARIELLQGEGAPTAKRGAGSIHHIAFRAADDQAQADMVAALRKLGIETTPPIDRTYFRAVYFREPSGVLLAIATDGPGFGVDENIERLGERLMLPETLEEQRLKILTRLPDL